MTAADLAQWRHAMGFNQQQAAAALGISKRAYLYLELGERDGRATRIDRRTALACAALYHRLAPWDEVQAPAGNAAQAASGKRRP